MSYYNKNNLNLKRVRSIEAKQTSHQFFQHHTFDTQFGTSAQSMNTVINAQSSVKVFADRTHVQITNPVINSTGQILVSRSDDVATYPVWALDPGDTIKEPCSGSNDFYIALVGAPVVLIEELG